MLHIRKEYINFMNMKNLSVLLVAVMLCFGCSSASEDAVVDFKVDDPVAGEVVVVCHNNINVLPLDEAGCASYTMTGSEMAYLKVFHGRESLLLYVEEGDAVTVSFNGHNVKGSYMFEGEKAPAVKYLNTVSLIALPDEDYALPLAEYIERLAAKEADAVRLLKANGLSTVGDFEENEADRIRYSYAAQLIMYPMAHSIMSGNMEYRPEEGYYDVIASYVVEDERLACLDEYLSFVAEAMHVLDTEGRDITSVYPKTVAQVKYAADNLSNPKIKEVIMHHIAAAYVDNFGVKDISELENLYHTYVKDSLLTASYAAKRDRWDLSRAGRMSPGFRAPDVDGKEYTLSDFRGKYVYIDMWATWCGPCKSEMPYLKALEEEFADAEIVFLGLSIDRDKAAWEKMNKEGGLTGVQLYLGLGSRFQDAYRVESIPRFILLDKEGKIISNDMSRPSAQETAETLRKLEGMWL